MNKLLIMSLLLTFMGQAAAEATKVEAPVVDPNAVVTPSINSQSYELGAYFGSMRVIADSDNTIIFGSRLSYHINERMFIEGSLAKMQISKTLGSGEIEHDNSDVGSYYYNASAGFNLVPGELFIADGVIIPIYIYGLVGAGNTVIDDTDTFSINFGGGMRVLVTDEFALRLDVQDHIFDAGTSLGASNEDKFSWNNMEVTVGLSWFF